MKKLPQIYKLVELFLKRNKEMVLTVVFISVGVDIFLPYKSIDIVIFIILFFYVVASLIYKLKSSFTLLLCLGLICVMSLEFIITQTSIHTEKAAVWFIVFITIATIQKFKE